MPPTWKSSVVDSTIDGKKALVYNLILDGPDVDTSQKYKNYKKEVVTEILGYNDIAKPTGVIISPGSTTNWYIKATKKWCNFLGIGDGPIYLSFAFFKAVGLSKYSFSTLKDDQIFLIPARLEDGTSAIVRLGSSFKLGGVSYPKLWTDIYKDAASIELSPNDGAAFRAYNADVGLTLYILPPGNNYANANTKRNGVSWNEVKAAFEAVKDPKIRPTYILGIEGKPVTDYVLLWKSPFEHFETWMLKKDAIEYFKKYSDRPFPTLKQLQGLDNRMFFGTGAKVKTREQEVMENNDHINIEEGLIVVSLSSDRIISAAGKRKAAGIDSQAVVMGNVSAPLLATNTLGWVDQPKGLFRPAEWLHLGAFSYGGLDDTSSESWKTSQIPQNLVLGTSETNSVMLRYEKAWQKFFTLEGQLRTAWKAKYENKKPPPTIPATPVTGKLWIHVNKDLTFKSFRASTDGKTLEVVSNVFNNDQNWKACFNKCSFICYVMHYWIEMDSPSLLLDWDKPKLEIEFYPFTRPFFTRGETYVDTGLLDQVYKRKINELNLMN